MIEDVKRDVAAFIGLHVPLLTGKVTSTFPDNVRAASPCAIVDVVGGIGKRTLQLDLTDLLIRVSIISNDVMEIDSITDDLVDDALKNHPDALTTIYYGGIHDVSPVMELFVEKEKYKVFVREIDISAKFKQKR